MCVCVCVCGCARACVRACVRCVSIRLKSSLDHTKTVGDKSAIFSLSCRPLKRHPMTYSVNLYLMIFYFLMVIYSNTDDLRRLNVIILLMVTGRAKLTIASNTMLHVVFRLAYLELILTYSDGQLSR